MVDAVLTLNSGSSSVKFGLFECGEVPVELMSGQVSGLGGDARIDIKTPDGEALLNKDLIDSTTHGDALRAILDSLPQYAEFGSIVGVGHRIVFGGPDLDRPAVLDDALLKKLEVYVPFAPLHQPYNLAGVRAAREAFPNAVQVGCFDTAFHRDNDWVHEAFALPRHFYESGVRRYGFHGLSYQFISEELTRKHPAIANGRVVVAHLGNGASMCALREGLSVDSTMGFTALDGLPMGTRCGALDPGVVLYMVDQLGMSPNEVTDVLYKQSGLKGLSGIGNDMRALLNSTEESARQAISYFVERIRRELGALTAVLGGLDAFVFCGGIGENAAPIRERVCAGFEWLGIELDTQRNVAGGPVITADASATQVLVINTDEEWVIARAASSCV